MKFLLNKLRRIRTEPDGAEIYSDDEGEKTVYVHESGGRAVVRVNGREAVLVLDPEGRWIPEGNDWCKLAEVLDAPGLARAPFGF